MAYNWKRFFYPREKRISLSDGGFFYDPDSALGSRINPDVQSFEDIIEYPCLVILGEPGIGKTVTLEKGYDSLESEISRQGDHLFWIDLRGYGSEVRLSQDLFQSPVFTEWLSGDYDLHIFLDSLDECLLQLKHVSAFLLDQLQKIPIDRLKIRISCRTSEWPKVLEEARAQMLEFLYYFVSILCNWRITKIRRKNGVAV